MPKRKEKECIQTTSKKKNKNQTSISAFFTTTKTDQLKENSQNLESTPSSTQESDNSSITKTEQLQRESEEIKAIKIETIDDESELTIERVDRSEVVEAAAEVKSRMNEMEEDPEIEDEEEKEIPFYTMSIYTDHVLDILNTVLEGEAYLFDKKELELFDRFKKLDGNNNNNRNNNGNSKNDINTCEDDAQHLFVRLLLRKHKWILYDKINYENNIKDKDKAIQLLSDNDFIEKESDLVDLDTALNTLNRTQLKEITKAMHIKTQSSSKRSDVILSIRKYAQQSNSDLQSRYGDSNKDSTIKQLWTLIYSHIGSCVRIRDPAFESFQRLQIIYYRLNMLNGDNHMTSSILVKMDKRAYPQYTISRTCTLWSSRWDYLQYEEALLTEKKFEESLNVIRMSHKNKHNEELSKAIYSDCWALCEEKISLWELFVEKAQETAPAYYLRRFEAGWIYTRLLHHGLEILSKMREYKLESIVLKKLLKQRVYQLSRRGTWYERLSLIQMTYLCDKSLKTDRLKLKEALQTCIDAVHDPRVHQIHLHNIYKKINRLERKLCIPKREQHDFSYLTLKTPNKITIHGERLSKEEIGKKSRWRSKSGAECSVEEIALEYYEKQGYKGFHAENGVIRMICTLLLWDAIFAPIPGVFETPYQRAPLDLNSGEFYEARLELINQILMDIAGGNYLSTLKTVYDRESPKNTMCIGINWKYELDDILEIAECIGPDSLSSLCKLLFEEFGQRSSGMPDLCWTQKVRINFISYHGSCWNYKEKKCLFSEVKGPGDRLSDTQKLWIEALSGFGIQVEVCHVEVWLGEDVFLDQK